MAWPTVAMAEIGLWGDAGLAGARAVYTEIAREIARREPITMVAAPADAAIAATVCGTEVEVVPLPIDDSWMRDTGPIVVIADDGFRHALHFQFNAWGEKWSPWEADAAVGAAIAAHLGLPVREVPMVLEGGSIAVDGAGLLVTTERCLLNKNRNPRMSKTEIEQALCRNLGVEQIVWLADAIAEDDGTDGHVDNVVAFCAPGARASARLRRPREPEPRDRTRQPTRPSKPRGSRWSKSRCFRMRASGRVACSRCPT